MTSCKERSGWFETIVWTIFSCSLLLGALGLAPGSRGLTLGSWAERAFDVLRLLLRNRGAGDCGRAGREGGGAGVSPAVVVQPLVANSVVGRLRISTKLACWSCGRKASVCSGLG